MEEEKDTRKSKIPRPPFEHCSALFIVLCASQCVRRNVCVCVNEQEQWEISKLKMLNRHLKMAADGGHSHSHGHGQPHTGHVRSVVWE